MTIRCLALLLLLPLLAFPARANQSISGTCSTGNIRVSTGGLTSTTRVLGSYPLCTVTVYDHGTTTKSTLFSDNLSSIVAITISSGGTGYTASDVVIPLEIGGSGATYQIDTVDGSGTALTGHLVTAGTGYSVSSDLPASGGTGTGLRLSIPAVYSTPLANPFTALSDGSFSFYASLGRYDYCLTGGSPSTLPATVCVYDIILQDSLSDFLNVARLSGATFLGPVTAPHFYGPLDGIVGSVTPAAGYFTTLTASQASFFLDDLTVTDALSAGSFSGPTAEFTVLGVGNAAPLSGIKVTGGLELASASIKFADGSTQSVSAGLAAAVINGTKTPNGCVQLDATGTYLVALGGACGLASGSTVTSVAATDPLSATGTTSVTVALTGIVDSTHGGTGSANTATIGRGLVGDGTNFVTSSSAAVFAGQANTFGAYLQDFKSSTLRLPDTTPATEGYLAYIYTTHLLTYHNGTAVKTVATIDGTVAQATASGVAPDATNANEYVLFAASTSTYVTNHTDADFTYNPATNILTAVHFAGALTGNASTATALAANPTNCSAGQAAAGIDASGNAEGCTSISGAIYSYHSVTAATYTILTTDRTIGVNRAGTVALTLPDATALTAGTSIVIKDESGAAETYAITVTPFGSQKIDGASSATLNVNYDVRRLYTNGANWFLQ